jgi:hypothetical protein
MGTKKDLVVHRFRPSGRVEIIRLSLAGLVWKAIFYGLILVVVSTLGSFIVFMKMFPQGLESYRTQKPAQERPAAPALIAREEEKVAVETPRPAAEEEEKAEEPEPVAMEAVETPAIPETPPDVDIRNFRVIRNRDGINVSLTVNNTLDDGSAVSGYVVMVLNTKDGETYTYPDVGLDENGSPREPRRGRRFTIKRLIVLTATFPVAPGDADVMSVYCYDSKGNLKLTKDFEGFKKPTGGPS